MNQTPRYSADEFERESRYIDNLIWDALVIEPGTRVLFCGYGEDARWIHRAMEAGADVSVIEHREQVFHKFQNIGAALLRGSTSVIPAKADTFDLAVAFHYLHEQDPFFHAQIVSELSRVAQRVAVVEPGPPADPIGKRIARLYSQAKRELGQFEYYQPLEYWRKLLQAVKADISQHVFAFAKIPPLEYLRDTIELLLDTMEVEDAPRTDLEELRALARRTDTMILPPPRYVLMGAAVGDLRQPIFTPREEPTPTPEVAKAAQSREPVPEPPIVEPMRAAAAPPPMPSLNWSTWTPETPKPATAQPAAPPPASPFGIGAAAPPPPAPMETGMPFGAPFAVPGVQAPADAASPFGLPPIPGPPGMPGPTGWHWEPPEDEESGNPE
ncbi:MAG TPA: class I SAM-dependent methyltransferase [Candidatus Baltobacteraceae bacterium]|nr:class I SAM-dependent methyltransferase [Candidatus Baltobacteraceae bacterium]